MIDQDTAAKFDNALFEIHTLLSEAMFYENYRARIDRAEEMMNDLRNEWAAISGQPLRFASFPASE